jgi:hypothetical protein
MLWAGTDVSEQLAASVCGVTTYSALNMYAGKLLAIYKTARHHILYDRNILTFIAMGTPIPYK